MSNVGFDTTDFDRAAIAIHRFASYIDDADVLEGAKEIAKTDMAIRFDSQIDPAGHKWQKLSTVYAEAKIRAGFPVHPILTRTEDLRNAASSEGAWSVSGEAVWFNTAGLPPYWEAHDPQDMTRVMGRAARVQTITMDGAEVVVGEYGGLPIRRFIGLSAEAREKIEALIDRWIDHGLNEMELDFTESGGGAQLFPPGMSSIAPGAGGKPQFRTAGGRFGPMA